MNQTPKPIILEHLIDAPKELVWKALTTIDMLKKWLPFFNDFKPEVGFTTRFELGRGEGKKYVHICEVTEAEENKRLTYSWRYADQAGDSYVTFNLTPQGSKTMVTLTHTITEPFSTENPDFALRNFVEGWTAIINNLKQYMEEK